MFLIINCALNGSKKIKLFIEKSINFEMSVRCIYVFFFNVQFIFDSARFRNMYNMFQKNKINVLFV